MSTFSIYDWLRRNSEPRGSHALITPGKRATTYDQLHDLSISLAADLATIGIGRGSTVGLAIESRDAMAAALLTVGARATVVPFSITELRSMRHERLARLKMDAVLIETSDEAALSRLSELGIPMVNVVVNTEFAGLFGLDVDPPSAKASDDFPHTSDFFVLLETTGTTGDPKVAPITHSSILTTGQRSITSLDVGPEDRQLIVRPLHHSGGIHELARGLVSRIPIVIADFSPDTLVDIVLEYGATWFALVPSMHRAVLPFARARSEELRRSSLRYVRSDSSLLIPELKAQLEEAWGAPIIQGYGSTEAGTLAINNWNGKPGSVGEVPAGIVSIRDLEGNELPLGQVGEVCATGPTAFPGYLEDPNGSREAFHGEWYRMGDLGYLDEDGYLFLTGRIKESINRGGETVSPGEIEIVISGLDEVEECSVFGVPHRTLGEEIYAAVKLEPGISMSSPQLRSKLSHRLPFSKVPKRVAFVEQFPLNRFGKVDRAELSRMFGGQAEKPVEAEHSQFRDTEQVS